MCFICDLVELLGGELRGCFSKPLVVPKKHSKVRSTFNGEWEFEDLSGDLIRVSTFLIFIIMHPINYSKTVQI